MFNIAARYCLFLSIAMMLTGCKVAAIVVEGGEVHSADFGSCQPVVPGVTGIACLYEVTEAVEFTAVPDDGWHFVKWNSGGDFLCRDSIEPTCVVTDEGAALEPPVQSNTTFYIMPVFALGAPITDTANGDGKEWAQPDLFTNVSWNSINAVCPRGICSGTLKGYGMTGWTWASVDDLNSLFNTYIYPYSMGPGPERLELNDGTFNAALGAAGWRYTYLQEGAVGMIGHTSSSVPGDVNRAYRAGIAEVYFIDLVDTSFTGLKSEYRSDTGAWFYRTP